jgi:aspartate carbamoyltransferase catalytic subunit
MSQGDHAVAVTRDWRQFMDMPEFGGAATATQGLFLRDALVQLQLDRDGLADRIGVSRKCLNRWMVARESAEFRAMPRMAWKFITEIAGCRLAET